MCQVICLICINSRINYHPLVIKPIGGDAYEVFTIYLICRIFLCPRAILSFHSPWAHGHYEPTENIHRAFILPWGRSRILRMSKLCSCGIEAMFLWGWSHVCVGLKLCSQCCNAIEKDCSLRREWLEPTQRPFVRQAAKANVENGSVLPSWQNKD